MEKCQKNIGVLDQTKTHILPLKPDIAVSMPWVASTVSARLWNGYSLLSFKGVKKMLFSHSIAMGSGVVFHAFFRPGLCRYLFI